MHTREVTSFATKAVITIAEVVETDAIRAFGQFWVAMVWQYIDSNK